MTSYWDRHSESDRAVMKSFLMPLVAATKPRDFIDQASARVQVTAFLQALEDVPKPIVEAGVTNLVRNGLTWMPKPGEVKSECAKVLEQRRRAAMTHALEHCHHDKHWIEVERDGVSRITRCPCWQTGLEAQAKLGQPIALPAALELSESAS